jgi:hypothetical protein
VTQIPKQNNVREELPILGSWFLRFRSTVFGSIDSGLGLRESRNHGGRRMWRRRLLTSWHRKPSEQ